MMTIRIISTPNSHSSARQFQIVYILVGKKKRYKALFKGFVASSTQGRDRTGMRVNSLVFETSASTNSATWAIPLERAAKVFIFLK